MTEKIRTMTADQMAALHVYAQRWIDKVSHSERVPDEIIRDGMNELLSLLRLTRREIHIVDSLFSAQVLANRLGGTNAVYYPTDIVGLSGSSWMAYYTFFHSVLNVSVPQIFQDYCKIMEMTKIWDMIGFDNAVIVIRSPKCIHRDSEGRPHKEDGPCVEWWDGEGNYMWHGVNVPKKVVDGNFTREDVLNEKNREVMRCMVEKMGPEKFISELGAKVIHADVDGGGMPRQLLTVSIEETEWRLCRVKDPSTGREYYLRVPPTVTRCREAVAWTFGVDPESYVTVKET